MTPLHPVASAKAPCTSTTVGLVSVASPEADERSHGSKASHKRAKMPATPARNTNHRVRLLTLRVVDISFSLFANGGAVGKVAWELFGWMQVRLTPPEGFASENSA